MSLFKMSPWYCGYSGHSCCNVCFVHPVSFSFFVVVVILHGTSWVHWYRCDEKGLIFCQDAKLDDGWITHLICFGVKHLLFDSFWAGGLFAGFLGVCFSCFRVAISLGCFRCLLVAIQRKKTAPIRCVVWHLLTSYLCDGCARVGRVPTPWHNPLVQAVS